MTFEEACEIALRLPGVVRSTSYGTPALKVGRHLLARLKEDGTSLVIRVGSLDEKDFLLESQPDLFFTTPHYDGYAAVLARLDVLPAPVLASLLERVWRDRAPKRLLRGPPGGS